MRRRAAQWAEPAAGLAVAGLLWLVTPVFAVYLAVVVLLLWIESGTILRRDRAERIRMQDAMAMQAFRQRVLEEIDDRRPFRETVDAILSV